MINSLNAAILVIGNEILSGSTQDANISFIAKRLAARGVELTEVRIVRDVETQIVGTLNDLRSKYKYVFTTGGIGPTHDDITAECVSKAFGVPHVIHQGVRQEMEELYKARGVELNAARLRMATMPEGCELVKNPVSGPPGFKMGNVFVMAGVPKIMQGMFEHVETMLEAGKPMLARTVRCNQREGDIAEALGTVQKAYPDIDIGSYPHMFQTPSLSLILRGTDEAQLAAATAEVAALVKARGEEPEIV
ncbi:MAG: molybdopterin-binding protein [Micavibrio sp.]|nr:molybdopterin-binding protein [Micavibrio sp.]